MYKISLLNAKGGVSKSVSAAAIASLLTKAGFKVLLIDLDPQANLSSLFGVSAKLPLAQLLAEPSDKQSIDDYICKTPYKNISVVPGDTSLTRVIYQLYDQSKDNDISDRLQKKLNSVQSKFDYIIIDNSPFESFLTTISLCASDLVLAPIDVDNFSYEGLLLLFDNIQRTNRQGD